MSGTVDDNKRYAIEKLEKIKTFLDFVNLCQHDEWFSIEDRDLDYGIRGCKKIIDNVFELHNIEKNKKEY